MRIVLIILGIILVFIAILLFAGINILFDLGYKEDKVIAKIRVYVLNEVFGKSFDFSDDEEDDDKEQDDEETETEQTDDAENDDVKEADSQKKDESEEEHHVKSFFKKIKRKIRKFLNYKNAFIVSRSKLRKKFIFKKLDISVIYGNGDAAKTAMTTGAVWALVYNIIGFISRTATIKNHSEKVQPEFNKNEFSLSVSGIFKTRLVHIIYAILLIRHNFKKIENRQTDEK